MECTPRGIWMYESGDGPSFVPGSETSTWAGRGQDFQAFLLQVRRPYRGWKVTVLLDSDSSHKAKTSQTLATQLGIRLLWLPKRAPEMNPMDTLWGQAKDVISANNQYTSIDQPVESFITHLSSLSNKDALRTSGVPSARFWLRQVLSKNFCGPA
jgi:hypothetical protein